MPPPIPAHQKRFTANPSRPARYRPGKVVTEEDSSEEEDEEEGEEVEETRQPQRKPQQTSARPKPRVAPDEDEDDDEEGFVTEEEDKDEEEDDKKTRRSVSTPNAATKITPIASRSAQQPTKAQLLDSKSEDEDSESESEGDEDESEESEEDSSSEEEAPQRKFQRPTFIKKTDRNVAPAAQTELETDQNSTPVPDVSSSHHDESTSARRLAEAESLIKLTIERDTAARLAGKKSWDDDDDLPAEALVDDTDGVNPEAEHSAWRLRELHRLKRDREAMIAREKELEEIERRRNLTAEEREAEDREFISKQNEEREEGRGKAAYLSKYHHKGAFFLDDENSARLAKRDLAGAKFADDVADKSVLPEYMRVRDMTKLGKKGRTRYTDLKGQDTGRFGDDVKRWRGSGYNNNQEGGPAQNLKDVDERFLPDDERERRFGGGPQASGANASAVGQRRERRRSRSRSADDRDRRKSHRDHDSYRPRSRSRSLSRDRRRRRRSYSTSPSRSRSPGRSTSRSPVHKSRRRRSPSPYHERDRDRDKRRRIEF